MIYELSSCPNTQNKPGDELLTPVGVSSLVVKNGKHYLFWLKTVSWNKDREIWEKNGIKF